MTKKQLIFVANSILAGMAVAMLRRLILYLYRNYSFDQDEFRFWLGIVRQSMNTLSVDFVLLALGLWFMALARRK